MQYTGMQFSFPGEIPLSAGQGRNHVSMPERSALQEKLVYEILSVVGEIPEGCVATYGQIARLIGRDKNARLVGKALSMAGDYGDYPCHRVVDHSGRLVPGWQEQGTLLEAEGVKWKDDTHVDLRQCQWDC